MRKSSAGLPRCYRILSWDKYKDGLLTVALKSVKEKKFCIKCAAASHGFGAGASPPMQLTKGHSALKLCEIGEFERHVGR